MTRNTPWLCDRIDEARAALIVFDFRAADRIRSELYGSGVNLAWFAAEEVGKDMARARDEARGLEKLRRFG